MKHLITEGIVLHRVNYGEADRILTVLTPDYGKLSLMARGVRREKSKLAGGVELFSITEIGFIPGRGEIATLTSSRLKRHMAYITKDLDRTMLGYEILKILHKTTEDKTEAEYFHLLTEILEGLNQLEIADNLVSLWSNTRLLSVSGHSPNVQTDTLGHQLNQKHSYNFDTQEMAFVPHTSGQYGTNDIKLLRLALKEPLSRVGRLKIDTRTLEAVSHLAQQLRNYYLHI